MQCTLQCTAQQRPGQAQDAMRLEATATVLCGTCMGAFIPMHVQGISKVNMADWLHKTLMSQVRFVSKQSEIGWLVWKDLMYHAHPTLQMLETLHSQQGMHVRQMLPLHVASRCWKRMLRGEAQVHT